MPEIPSQKQEPETRTITDGYFEEEFHLDAQAAGEFLIALGEQIRDGDEVEITGDGWRLPFAFGGPVELEIDFEGDDPELEIEVELKGRHRGDEAPTVG